MRIRINNEAEINVKTNFNISYKEAVNISQELNIYLESINHARTTTAAGVYAVNLIGQVFQYIFTNHVKKNDPNILTRTMEHVNSSISRKETDRVVGIFTEEFPTDGDSMEEMVVLRLTNENPACNPYSVIFEEMNLAENTAYVDVLKKSFSYLKNFQSPGGEGVNLIDFLKAPSVAHPGSRIDQLTYMAENWKSLLGDQFLQLLRGIDYLKEENKPQFPPGPGPMEEYTYDYADGSPEGFSNDSNWMPNVVMMAKSTLVWLDQLSKQYETSITRLDQIPDEELDLLSNRGFSALWLIGLWERSNASKQIKRTCGNPEAESSAYSLKRYEIAEELGGWEALHNLKYRCARRGIRLASDMVPNHTGIDSDWINGHPDWFLQLPYSPYPNYSFNGQNLSPDPGIGIYIEDHYYDQTDAAVTFKRVDFQSGDERHIYHGNDGTSMPWNDTAQLDYLNPEAREAVIQTILHVARNFPVIRFDAAMTLAKKHIQRLWFPEPGSGGDIPTRSERGLSRSEFNKAIPIEFWRDVVDRIKEEAPDTLLLAEAFWMMEGYFVKNLGMHRVYNSAFMNMLKMEENHTYKNTIKNTLIFEPEILKRFVNFMNNPDEDTAAAQFGMGDKYFGICTMMITMPGLPMFGHGQIEGYKEKYGMEYRKAYHNEVPDTGFVQRHGKEIFPLIKKRYLFSESENFNLYDMFDFQENVNENVFAWSNSKGNEYALIFFNNSYNSTDGWIRTTVPKSNESDKNIAIALGLQHNSDNYCIFREQRSSLMFIRNSKQIHESGIYLHLNGYESQVFMDFREVYDEDGQWGKLAAELNGQGTTDIDRAFRRLKLKPAAIRLLNIFQPSLTDGLKTLVLEKSADHTSFKDELHRLHLLFLSELESTPYTDKESMKNVDSLLIQTLQAIESLGQMYHRENEVKPRWLEYIFRGFGMMPEVWTLLLTWITFFPLTKLKLDSERDNNELLNMELIELMEDLNLDHNIRHSLAKSGIEEPDFHELLKLALIIPAYKESTSEFLILEKYINHPIVAELIGKNYHNNIEWFGRESFQLFSWWIFTLEALKLMLNNVDSRQIDDIFKILLQWLNGEENSECQIERLLDSVRKL